MMIKKIGIALGLMLISLSVFSQTRLPSMTVKDIDKLTAFEELVELFAESDYFIQNIEKDAGLFK